MRGIHMMLHNALDRAVKERLILRNPTEDCIIPKIQKQEMKILHPEDMKAYLEAANKRGVLPMFYLELVTGIRKGELTALLWSNLDEEKRTISVSKISIPESAIELLQQEHKKHPDSPWMFPSPRTREMYHPDSIAKLHEKILRDTGLEHIRFHDLRHTFATMALQNGVDVKTVSSMLGHYDAGFTLRTYTHATRQMQEQAAEKMGSFMDKVYSMMGVDVGDTYEEEYYDDYAQGGYDEPDPNESYMPSRRNSGRNAGRVNRYEDNPQMKLVIMQPVSFEEARDIADSNKS